MGVNRMEFHMQKQCEEKGGFVAVLDCAASVFLFSIINYIDQIDVNDVLLGMMEKCFCIFFLQLQS